LDDDKVVAAAVRKTLVSGERGGIVVVLRKQIEEEG
jgi:hypothetical protein